MAFFTIRKPAGSRARNGVISTDHGRVETPIFMPVGTQGAVKAIAPPQLIELGAQIILGNTYHLNLRPGPELLDQFDGLHKFIGWDLPILTDSGGFQVFSLKGISKVTEEGVSFSSHIDGSKHFISPEKSISIQNSIGSNIMMVLDQLVPADSGRQVFEEAMQRSVRWAKRCLDFHKANSADQTLFAIQQGGFDEQLRKESAARLTELEFDGFAVGGLSVGETKEEMYDTAEFSVEMLPADKPRYIMGVGTPEDLLNFISMGYDMFDCVLPTRNARTGLLYTRRGTIVIKNSRFKSDEKPIDPQCSCYVCSNFSRAYLRHLFIAREILGVMLNTYHNLHFYLNMMKEVRKAISDNIFEPYKKSFLADYSSELSP